LIIEALTANTAAVTFLHHLFIAFAAAIARMLWSAPAVPPLEFNLDLVEDLRSLLGEREGGTERLELTPPSKKPIESLGGSDVPPVESRC
jgi:hypothetical protein